MFEASTFVPEFMVAAVLAPAMTNSSSQYGFFIQSAG